MDAIVNLELLKSPLNWLTVFLMVAFGLFLLALIAPEASQAIGPPQTY